MPNQPHGFYVSLSHDRPSFRNHNITRGISFQLKTDGVRYFLVVTNDEKRVLRDISTQYRSLTRDRYSAMSISEEETNKTHARLVAHAREFYPEDVVPTTWNSRKVYSWVAFPMIGAAMKQSGLEAPLGVNLQVASGLRAFTVRDMTSRIFGEAPKQLQAASAESLVRGSGITEGTKMVNLDNLTLASLLRGYLPPNGLADVLRMNFPHEGIIQQIDKNSANNIRLLLRRFSSQRITRLVESLTIDIRGDMLLRDAANQYADARKNHPDLVMDLSRQFRSFEELHQSVSREYRKLLNPNVEIPYSDERIADLESIELPDGSKLIWPAQTHDLMDWSSDSVMNNCIYSYGNDAAAGKSLLLAVLDGTGKMIINIMVRGQNVIQCYGKSNETVTDETLLEAVFKGLIDANIVSPENDHLTWTGRGRWY